MIDAAAGEMRFIFTLTSTPRPEAMRVGVAALRWCGVLAVRRREILEELNARGRAIVRL